MEVRFLSDIKFAFDGIRVQDVKKGAVLHVSTKDAAYLLERKIAEQVKAPVAENKMANPTYERKKGGK